MPFVPLNPEEQERYKPPCTHPEHNPPTHIVIRTVVKWLCPGCGRTIIIRPRSHTIRWTKKPLVLSRVEETLDSVKTMK